MPNDESIPSDGFNPATLPDYPELDETGLVDVAQIDSMLRLTPTERVKLHQGFLELMEIARKARIDRYGYDPAAGGSSEMPE